MEFSEIWEHVWMVIQVIAGLPIAIYVVADSILPSIFTFSSAHEWWHNLILAFVWLGLYSGLTGMAMGFVIGQYAQQSYMTERKYGVKLFPKWVGILYLIGMVFPFIVKCPFFYFKPWAVWFSLGFPAIVWLYYLLKTGVGILPILLRQLYVALLVLAFLCLMLYPAMFIIIFMLLGGSLGDYISDSKPKEYVERTTTTYEDGSEEIEDTYLNY
jgi:hypothetical protein